MYNEQFRPTFHYSPRENWMNDPNGLVYYKGKYHLFYQHNPDDSVWGPMHWGHAVSKDLLNWEELPIALFPDELGQIFSGSAVIDKNNTSGLKESTDEDLLVSIFTHHGEDNEKQSIAYSLDRGKTWTKFEGNPVIKNPGIKDFRDPKVFWHEKTQKWVMSLACGDCVYFYGSTNLIDWDKLSVFGVEYGAHGGVWECPDLIELEIEGESEKKWVLFVSINPGGPNKGSAMQYFVGDFDGTNFICDDSKDKIKWADYGRDFYAAVTWHNAPEPTWIGWMSNWEYANQVPTAPYRSTMSLPRKLCLRRIDGELTLVQKPIDLSPIYKERVISNETISLKSNEETSIELNNNLQFEFKASLLPNKNQSFSLTLKGDKEHLQINFDLDTQEVRIDRTNSGNVDFSPHFPSVDSMPIKEVNDFLIIVDKSSIELFINDGSRVMTDLFFPIEEEHTLEMKAIDGEITFSDVCLTYLE